MNHIINYTKLCYFLVKNDIRRYTLLDVLDPDAYRCIGSVRPISYDDLLKLCSFLECEPEDIFDDDDLTFIFNGGEKHELL